MVKAAPNKVRILGRILKRGPARLGAVVDPDFMLLQVLVEEALHTTGSANPFKKAIGGTIDVLVPHDLTSNAPGDRFDAKVSMTRPGRAVLAK